jgi:mediator of RNA polymerase II transcription subunit 31
MEHDDELSFIEQQEQHAQPEQDEERRFQIELEFVQSLANPNYLNFLAQRGYFKSPSFRNYLKYLMYWKEPQYCQYLVYPQCLSLLEMLQHEQFLKEIVNAQCSKYIDEQLLLLWLHYKKRHDWIRLDPTKVSHVKVEKLMQKKQNQQEQELLFEGTAGVFDNDINEDEASEDAFSVARFMVNEKF